MQRWPDEPSPTAWRSSALSARPTWAPRVPRLGRLCHALGKALSGRASSTNTSSLNISGATRTLVSRHPQTNFSLPRLNSLHGGSTLDVVLLSSSPQRGLDCWRILTLPSFIDHTTQYNIAEATKTLHLDNATISDDPKDGLCGAVSFLRLPDCISSLNPLVQSRICQGLDMSQDSRSHNKRRWRPRVFRGIGSLKRCAIFLALVCGQQDHHILLWRTFADEERRQHWRALCPRRQAANSHD